MQWKWKACYFALGLVWYPGSVGVMSEERRTLQMPQATVHSSLVAEAWFA